MSNQNIQEANGEREVSITPLTRMIRFTCFGPGSLEVSLPEKKQQISIVRDASRILRTDGCTVLFLRTSTTTEYQLKEIK